MVVDHQTVRLLRSYFVPLVGEAAVDAGDRLQETMLMHGPIQVERLLHRRVETGQQHVNDDQNLRLAFRVDERVGDLLVVEIARRAELRPVVGTAS